jgi:hypothetical protein
MKARLSPNCASQRVLWLSFSIVLFADHKKRRFLKKKKSLRVSNYMFHQKTINVKKHQRKCRKDVSKIN